MDLEYLAGLIVDFVHKFGYLGIFIMTFIESSFLPIPSEVTMVPAGYLVHQKQMHAIPVLVASTLGTVMGAYVNYWIASRLGRSFLLRYAKYFFLSEAKFAKVEQFFEQHGSISIFAGRLIPGVRHFISFPAGLARMDLKKFFTYTALGGAIWMATLMTLGYIIGENHELLHHWLPKVTGYIVVLTGLTVAIYIWRRRQNKQAASTIEQSTDHQ